MTESWFDFALRVIDHQFGGHGFAAEHTGRGAELSLCWHKPKFGDLRIKVSAYLDGLDEKHASLLFFVAPESELFASSNAKIAAWECPHPSFFFSDSLRRGLGQLSYIPIGMLIRKSTGVPHPSQWRVTLAEIDESSRNLVVEVLSAVDALFEGCDSYLDLLDVLETVDEFAQSLGRPSIFSDPPWVRSFSLAVSGNLDMAISCLESCFKSLSKADRRSRDGVKEDVAKTAFMTCRLQKQIAWLRSSKEQVGSG